MHRPTVAIVALGLALAACASTPDVEVADATSVEQDAGTPAEQEGADDDAEDAAAPAGEADQPEDETVIPTPAPSSEPDRPEPTTGAAGSGVVEQLPTGVLSPVLDDASERTGVPSSELVVDTAVAVQYADGSLGCPEPGMNYTQQLVSGYHVVLVAGDEVLDYRVGGPGSFRLCTGGGTVPVPDPDV